MALQLPLLLNPHTAMIIPEEKKGMFMSKEMTGTFTTTEITTTTEGMITTGGMKPIASVQKKEMPR